MDNNAKELLEKYLAGDCNLEEKAVVEQFYLSQWQRGSMPNENEHIRAEIWQHIQAAKDKQHSETTVRRSIFRRYYAATAAAAVLLIGIALWMYRPSSPIEQNAVLEQDSIMPGGNKATLILEDGSQIALSDLHKGIVVGDSITYEDGQIIGNTGEGQLLALQTPRGGQYAVTLPDGTKVWLNTASTLRYPVQFSSQERRVQLEGEAYFEVAKDKERQFIVQSKAQEIKVIGTHFNIDAYADNNYTATTLVEGAVQVKDNQSGQIAVLTPGQQANTTVQKGMILKTVDLYQYTSWKDGIYVLNNQPLHVLAKKLERWYNVSFDLENQGDVLISGVIQNKANLLEVLKGIENNTNVKFKLEERRVEVIK